MQRLIRKIGAFRRDERGNVGILFAAALIPVAVLSGGAVDYGRTIAEKARLQAAADAAALAGTRVAVSTAADRISVAEKVFKINTTGTSLSGVIPTITVNGNSVSVSAGKSVPTPFLQLANIPHLDALADAKSTGSNPNPVADPGKICLLALDPTSDDGIHLQGANLVNYIDCWAHTNSQKATAINAVGNNAKAVGKGHCAVGAWTQTHNTFTPLPQGACLTVQDPFATGSAYSGSYTPTFTQPTKAVNCKASNLSLKKGAFTLDPGRYCGGINIQAGATVTFNAGVYYIDNGVFNVQSGSSATGSNVIFYLEGAGARAQIIGGGTVNLTGRTSSSSYAGFLMIANPNANPMGESNIQGGGTFKLEGVIYLPKQRFDVAGNGDVNAVSLNVFGMVAKDFYFRGNGVFNANKHTGSGSIPDIMPSMPVTTLQQSSLK